MRENGELSSMLLLLLLLQRPLTSTRFDGEQQSAYGVGASRVWPTVGRTLDKAK